MKKYITVALLFLCVFILDAQVVQTASVDNTGATITLNPLSSPNLLLIYPASGSVSLSSNVTVAYSSNPPKGTHITIFVAAPFDLNGHNFNIFGLGIPQSYLNAVGYTFDVYYIDNAGTRIHSSYPTVISNGIPQGIDGNTIMDGTLNVASIDTLGGGRIWVGSSSNIPTSRAVTGDISISNTGVTTIDSGAIRDSMLAYNAAITRTKIATGSASQVIINDASGYLTSEATLNPSRGGLGANVASSTGFVTFNSGSSTVGAITFYETFAVSFDAASEIGDVKFKLPACTVTGVYAEVTKTVEATDSCTITPKDNSGTAMTSGIITLTAGTTIGTAFTSTPSANNTFTAGQIMTLSVAKATPGGKALVTITYTRTK